MDTALENLSQPDQEFNARAKDEVAKIYQDADITQVTQRCSVTSRVAPTDSQGLCIHNPGTLGFQNSNLNTLLSPGSSP